MLKSYRPTSPSQRNRKSLKKDVDFVRPNKRLTRPLKGPFARAGGTITVRDRSRGAKKHYRIIDFKRNKFDIEGTVASIEHDPNRGANIALINYVDGEKRYILAPLGLEKGHKVVSSSNASITVGNTLPIKNIPLGTEVHNVELNPGQGGKMARGAGTYVTLVAIDGNYANVKLPSGEIKKILVECLATVGTLTNPELRNVNLGKAGRNRHLGVRPHVRGVAHASPRQHPHGGSYKDNGVGMLGPKTPWGKPARGVKTRKRTHTTKYIVKERRRGKKR
ncbi:MAG TPA: 50S ribosomal protein L2 [candidate division WWE3 bacterium]|uniref:50S ribosomal protein L2 n=1 Tax=candidate division WWE3 bacterium TaxID=2053526 RepID=A0A7C1HGI1_UNCKA|nr:50S ribosomal protein L2 [candidate division WWE3 bacterium]